MGILLCEQIFWTFGFKIKACRQKLVTFCAHTHTHAAKLVVEMDIYLRCSYSVALQYGHYLHTHFFVCTVSVFNFRQNAISYALMLMHLSIAAHCANMFTLYIQSELPGPYNIIHHRIGPVLNYEYKRKQSFIVGVSSDQV